jgi:hypothetical protein
MLYKKKIFFGGGLNILSWIFHAKILKRNRTLCQSYIVLFFTVPTFNNPVRHVFPQSGVANDFGLVDYDTLSKVKKSPIRIVTGSSSWTI